MENKNAQSESTRLHKFVWIDAFNKAVVSDPRLGQAKIIRCGNSLASKDNGDGFFCSRRELAERTGVTEDEAKKAIQILKKHGWIRQVRRGGRAGNGASWASEYVLTIPSAGTNLTARDDTVDASTGESQEVKGGAERPQGGSYSPPIRPFPITPSNISDRAKQSATNEAAGKERESAEEEVTFKHPSVRGGGEWRVQVWRCPVCLHGGTEEIFDRTTTHLKYICSEGFLVEVPYTHVPQADHGLGSHYQVAAGDKAVDAITVTSLENEL